MPERPPKAWFKSAVRSLRRTTDTKDPEALAGWIWHHHMTPEAKRAALRGAEYDPTITLAPAVRTVPKILRMFDPQAIPKPEDYRGYDGDLVRIVYDVPEPDGSKVDLMEVSISMPQHVYDRLLNDLTEKDFEDIEVGDNNTLIVRRGASNHATNIFIQREK